jgi:hypothetical protein
MDATIYLLKVLLAACSAGVILYLLGVRIVPRWLQDAPRPPAHNPVGGESRRTERADSGRFRAPIVPFNPSTRTAIRRKQLDAASRLGDRSA